MTESIKTAGFLACAAVLVTAAAMVQPERFTPAVLSDEGQAFYPNFRDPEAAKSIEVIDYDEATATARPLKVEFKDHRWVIASNNDYPIDIGDRLVKTSAALMDLHKDRVRSDQAQDHVKYGVIDPLDQKVTSLQGRGKRVTLRDSQKNILADFILGKPVDGKPGWRYVRVPDGKRTYVVKTDADPSAKFVDWVNAGLLRMPSASIRKLVLDSYSVNPTAGTIEQAEPVAMTQGLGFWNTPAGSVKQEPMKALADALDKLKIVDAKAKPPGLAKDLREGKIQLSDATAMTLRPFGFLLMENGRIIATDGEMTVEMANGVAYQIRFGDVASNSSDSGKGAGGDRYLLVTTSWDANRAAAYGDTGNAGERASRDLNARFADWFYVISGADFQKIRLTKTEVLR
jgi:hypothetical protein